MTEQEGRTDSAVTISVFLQIPHGREADFETYLTGISDAAEEFPGFVDVRAFRPRGSGAELSDRAGIRQRTQPSTLAGVG